MLVLTLVNSNLCKQGAYLISYNDVMSYTVCVYYQLLCVYYKLLCVYYKLFCMSSTKDAQVLM